MTRTSASNDTPVPESTLTELFFESVDRHAGLVAFQRMPAEGVLEDISFDEALSIVRSVVASLDASGIERGERVAILAENRPEWAFVDYGCLCAAVIPVPIYPSLMAGQITYLLENSGARIVFATGAGRQGDRGRRRVPTGRHRGGLRPRRFRRGRGRGLEGFSRAGP